MQSHIRILHLEDNPKDSELIQARLESEGVPCEVVRVETQADFRDKLEAGGFDLVLSDYLLLGFDGMSALATLKQKFPQVPFILVTGTLGEEQAVESLKAGVSDFVLKGNLTRLAPSVRRALKEAEEQAQRRQAEEALRESEERYRALIEQSPDGIFLTDPETRCLVEANTAFQRLLGYSPEQIPTLSVYDLAVAPREEIDYRFNELLSRKEPTFLERQYRRKDGSLVEVWINSSVIYYGGKRATCTIVRDLTEKKALEAQLLRAQRMEAIGLLAGGIAHDLNNILSPILMNTELLQGMISGANYQKLLSSIATCAQRGAGIVRQILAFSRAREGEEILLSPPSTC
jgi:PAS domain S-box-containing protein